MRTVPAPDKNGWFPHDGTFVPAFTSGTKLWYRLAPGSVCFTGPDGTSEGRRDGARVYDNRSYWVHAGDSVKSCFPIVAFKIESGSLLNPIKYTSSSSDGWIPHTPGPRPVSADTRVVVKYLDGNISPENYADAWNSSWLGTYEVTNRNIVAYKIVGGKTKVQDIADLEDVTADQPKPNKQKETTKMKTSASIKFEQVTFVTAPGFSRTDAKTLTEDQIIDAIQASEAHIKELESIENKTQRVQKRIEDIYAGIKALVELSNSRTE